MENTGWHKFEAGYLVNRLSLYFSHFNRERLLFFFGFFVILIVSSIIALLLRRILQIIRSLTEPSVLLELTTPAFTDKSAYTTGQLFSVIHGLGKYQKLSNKLLGIKPRLSFEIVSTKTQGIRYLVRATPYYAKNLKRYILSYLPNVKVKETFEYLPLRNNQKVIEFILNRHFAYPLKQQSTLSEHDPVAYITGMMTKLSQDELISFQIVVSPMKTSECYNIKRMILHNENVLKYLDGFYTVPVISLFSTLISKIGNEFQWLITELIHPSTQGNFANQNRDYQQMQIHEHIKPARTLTTFEQETIQSIQQKIDQPLYEATIRLLVDVKNKQEERERIDGFISSLDNFAVPGYQSIIKKSLLSDYLFGKIRQFTFKKRLLSITGHGRSSLFSVSEIADLYHFPFSRITQTENIVKAYSKELPAPLSLKQDTKLDVVFGKNTYGGVTTNIGLTEEQRKTHMYILGRTGSGKTTLMFSMAKHDIEAGHGLAFIDPHGDVSEDLLASIPKNRIDDVIYVNPWDIQYPVGINVLELTEGLDENQAELEKEIVCEGVISLFKKVFAKDENSNAHRIEHILRNTIYTAFYVPDRTLFTINKLLTDDVFRRQTIAKVDDEDLLNFWKSEFGKAGDYQVVKMTQGVTAKVGRFLRSPTARRMLEQVKSTINFDEILNGKILICNLSQGKLGEDTTKLIGTTILTKIQQAALRRANVSQSARKPFYLYIDEFQNFATLSFIKIVSEGRKYGLHLIIAEQSTSQQQDKTIVNQILANITTIIVFRSGNYVDEELMLTQFSPYLQKGDIPNLPRYRFYIKISAIESEEPFSGETIYVPVDKDERLMENLVNTSRKNWAIVYKKPEKTVKKSAIISNNDQSVTRKFGLPKK